jgi:hypothetical protein
MPVTIGLPTTQKRQLIKQEAQASRLIVDKAPRPSVPSLKAWTLSVELLAAICVLSLNQGHKAVMAAFAGDSGYDVVLGGMLCQGAPLLLT